MTDKITIKLTYSRKEILDYAEKGKALGGDCHHIRQFLDQIYPAWSLDVRTSIMVSLMFLDETNEFFPLYTKKLAEL